MGPLPLLFGKQREHRHRTTCYWILSTPHCAPASHFRLRRQRAKRAFPTSLTGGVVRLGERRPPGFFPWT